MNKDMSKEVKKHNRRCILIGIISLIVFIAMSFYIIKEFFPSFNLFNTILYIDTPIESEIQSA